MDSTLTGAIARSIPSADSGMWPIYASLVTVMLIATLLLGPKALSAWGRYRWEKNPEQVERRSEPPPCSVHTETIRRLEARVADQEDEIAEIHVSMRASVEGLRSNIESLRAWMDSQFAADRLAGQSERIALTQQMSARFDGLMDLIIAERSK